MKGDSAFLKKKKKKQLLNSYFLTGLTISSLEDSYFYFHFKLLIILCIVAL